MSHSEALFERSKALVPGGVHSPVRAFRGVGGVPRFIASAKGAELYDVDGQQYVDYCMSWGPLILGHQDEDVRRSVHEAINRGWSYGTAEPYSLALAELITSRIPWVEKIRFVNSGTEAVMSALRVARGATGRNKIIKFEGCYHGHCDGLLVKAGSGLADMASPDSLGIPSSVAAETIVLPLNDINAVETAFNTHKNEIAAIILEPLPANNGLLVQKHSLIHTIVHIAHAHGTLVIFDEVISGFRIGFGGMSEHLDVTPDLVTYGKIIGGGFPVGAFGGRADLMDHVAPVGSVYQAGTLSANPVSMIAGLKTLEKLSMNPPYKSLELQTRALAKSIEEAVDTFPLRVQALGSVFWIVLGPIDTDDGVVRSPTQIPKHQCDVFPKLFHHLLHRGYYLSPSSFEVGFVSTAHTKTHHDGLVAAIQSFFNS